MPEPSCPNASLAPALATLMRVRWYEYQAAKLLRSASSDRPVGVTRVQFRQRQPLALPPSHWLEEFPEKANRARQTCPLASIWKR
jgi:hypothetical protein